MGGALARSGSEPPLKLAWPLAALAVALVALYWRQTLLVDQDAFIGQFGFTPAELLEGGWYQPVTALFVHGSWGHVLINTAFALAFGTPVVRRLGSSVLGAGLFLLFFLVCGVVGNAGYGLAHANGLGPVVGASGAIAGFLGGASRLIGQRRGVAALTSPNVVLMAAVIISTNVIVGIFHITGGPGSDGAPVAWETHIAGYLAGLLLIGLFDAAANGPRRS